MRGSGGLEDISLVVTTLNEEDNIGRCLGSAAGAGEIILVDSGSTDRTVEIAGEYGAKVYTRDFVSNSDQKNWAIAKSTLPWVLVLDADESLTDGLREEIAAAVRSGRMDGYWIYRRNEFLGSPIRHCGWDRDRVLRLFRRGKGRYPERAVHERLELDGSAGVLVSRMEHRPYRDLSDYIDRMKGYSRRGAVELSRSGRRWVPGIVTRPAARFLRMYFLQLGVLDGAAGLLLCGAAAAGVFFKYAWLREMSSQ